MAVPQRPAGKADHYPYGWWLVFGPRPSLPSVKVLKASKATVQKEQSRTISQSGPRPRGLISTPAETTRALSLPSAVKQPSPPSQTLDTSLNNTAVTEEVSQLPAQPPEKVEKKKVRFKDVKSVVDSLGSSASSLSSKKKVHFEDSDGGAPTNPQSKPKMSLLEDPPSSKLDFELLCGASDDSDTDVPPILPPYLSSHSLSSDLHTSTSLAASQTYILRPSPEHFGAGELHVLLILKGKAALKEAKKALRDGTWRRKYKDSQMYRVLE